MPGSSFPRISLKRVYEAPSSDDGLRLLVERLWPRGLSRDAAAVDRWLKDLAPSPELRRWYDHVPDRWPGFRDRYLGELQAAEAGAVGELVSLCRNQSVTFIFAARDEKRCSAVVLREFVLGKLGES